MRILRKSLYVLPVVGAVVLSGMGAASGVATGIPKNAKRVPVSVSKPATGIDATLPAAGAITGKVSIKGSSAPGSEISVNVVNAKHEFVSSGFTDSSGKYSALGLNTGKYFVCVFSTFSDPVVDKTAAPFGVVPQCAGSKAVANQFAVTKGATAFSVVRGHAKKVNLTLAPAGAISGSLKSGSKSLAGAVGVTIYKGATTVGSTFASSSTYQVNGVAPGSGYTVCFDARNAAGGPSKTGYLSQCWKNTPWTGSGKAPNGSKKVTVHSKANTKHIDTNLKVGGAVSGKITSAASGHKAVQSSLIQVFHGSTFVGSGVSSGNGTYQVNGLPTGSHKVCALGGTLGSSPSTTFGGRCFKNANWSGGRLPSSATAVSVKVGKNHGHINIQLPPSKAAKFGSISGKLTGPGGVGLGNAAAIAFKGGAALGQVVTQANGSYVISHLSVGSHYSVCFQTSGATPQTGSAPAAGYSPVCSKSVTWDGGPLPSGTKQVTVLANKTTKNVDATAGKGTQISGTIKLAGSGAASGLEAFVIDTKHVTVRTVQTDSSGHYTANGLAPSSTGYLVCFDAGFSNFVPPNNLGYLGQCWKNQLWTGSSGQGG